MLQIVHNRQRLSLGEPDFVAEGAQGKVFVKNKTAFKIMNDPSAALPDDKLRELSVLTHPAILAPTARIFDDRGRAIGHAMPVAPPGHSLSSLLAPAFCDKRGVDVSALHNLLARLFETIAFCHENGVAVVDLNPLNVHVADNFRQVYLMDVDSFQTRSFPATAVADTVLDVHAKRFGPESDWFSAAVISFWLLIGAHPYKGSHPTIATFDERRRRRLSALRPDVSLAPACRPRDSLPPALRNWLEAVLDNGERIPPPTDILSSSAAASASVAPARIGILTPAGRPIDVWIENGLLRLVDSQTRLPLPLSLTAESVGVAPNGRLLVLGGGQVVQIDFVDLADRALPRHKILAQARPFAAQLFAGVLVQNLLGAAFVSVFPGDGTGRQLRISELDATRAIDARYDPQAATLEMIVEKRGRYNALTFAVADAAATLVSARHDIDPASSGLISSASQILRSQTP